MELSRDILRVIVHDSNEMKTRNFMQIKHEGEAERIDS